MERSDLGIVQPLRGTSDRNNHMGEGPQFSRLCAGTRADHEKAIGSCAIDCVAILATGRQGGYRVDETRIIPFNQEIVMKIWNKPQVREQAVGMEVTAYLPADIDLI